MSILRGEADNYRRFPKYSQIAAPLTSMLKTSNTESAEPRCVIGVGGGGRKRAEPVGKYEVDEVGDSGGRSADFDRKFHPLYDSCITHLDAQDELINGLIN